MPVKTKSGKHGASTAKSNNNQPKKNVKSPGAKASNKNAEKKGTMAENVEGNNDTDQE